MSATCQECGKPLSDWARSTNICSTCWWRTQHWRVKPASRQMRKREMERGFSPKNLP